MSFSSCSSSISFTNFSASFFRANPIFLIMIISIPKSVKEHYYLYQAKHLMVLDLNASFHFHVNTPKFLLFKSKCEFFLSRFYNFYLLIFFELLLSFLQIIFFVINLQVYICLNLTLLSIFIFLMQ